MTSTALPTHRARPRCCTILLRAALALLAAIVGLTLGGWFARVSVLRSAAELWIVSDRPLPADAAVVLGGGLEDRPFAAAEYYRRGLVKKILVSNVRLGPAERLGVAKSETALVQEVLRNLGVPEGDVEVFGANLSSTHDEAVALRDWAQHDDARRLLVPTEIFAARRVRWMLHRVLGDQTVIAVQALDPPDYNRNDWWQHSQGLIAFETEILKYIYYRLKY